MIRFKINIFILFFVFSTQICATPKINNNDNLFHIDKGIYSIDLRGWDGSEGSVYSLRFYPKNPKSIGDPQEDIFRPISRNLNQIISHKSTENPFRNSFPKIYTVKNIAKRLKCPVKGVRLEVDNNPSTKEWLISFFAQKCLNNKNFILKDKEKNNIHQWILQQRTNGKYRILIEIESRLTSIENTNTYKGYKQIETSFSVKHTLPNYPLKCGDADITWKYAADNRYHIKSVLYNISNCRPIYLYNNTNPHLDEAKWKIDMKAKVIAAVNSWILPLEGQIPVKKKSKLYY